MFSRRKLLFSFTIASTVLLVGFFALMALRSVLISSISENIDRLALHPPQEVSQLEWAVVVYWTQNYHGACSPGLNASSLWLLETNSLLEATLEEGADGETIDMLWTHYARIGDEAANYGEVMMEERDSIARRVASQGRDYVDAQTYIDYLAFVRGDLLRKGKNGTHLNSRR